jgi:serine/threonine-protein kinase RsbW
MPTDQPDSCEFENDKLLLRLDITFAADVQAIAGVVDRILDLAKETSCMAGKEFEVQSALYEALTNAVIHGCKQDNTKTVQVTASCDLSKGILLVVRDPGEGFDVNSIPSPIQGERIFSSHGRGIFLINQLMDEVRFKRGGTEIHMLKK